MSQHNFKAGLAYNAKDGRTVFIMSSVNGTHDVWTRKGFSDTRIGVMSDAEFAALLGR